MCGGLSSKGVGMIDFIGEMLIILQPKTREQWLAAILTMALLGAVIWLFLSS